LQGCQLAQVLARKLRGTEPELGASELFEVGGLFGRGSTLAEIGQLGRRRSLDPSRLAVLYDDASTILDRLLLRFITAYQGAAETS